MTVKVPYIQSFFCFPEVVEFFRGEDFFDAYLEKYRALFEERNTPGLETFAPLFRNTNELVMGRELLEEKIGDRYFIHSPSKPRPFWTFPSQIKTNGKYFRNEIIDLCICSKNKEKARDRYRRILKCDREIREVFRNCIERFVMPGLARILYKEESAYLRGTVANKDRIITPYSEEDMDIFDIDVDIVVLTDREHISKYKLEMILRDYIANKIKFDVDVFKKEKIKQMIVEEDSDHKPYAYMLSNSVLLFGTEIREDPQITEALRKSGF